MWVVSSGDVSVTCIWLVYVTRQKWFNIKLTGYWWAGQGTTDVYLTHVPIIPGGACLVTSPALISRLPWKIPLMAFERNPWLWLTTNEEQISLGDWLSRYVMEQSVRKSLITSLKVTTRFMLRGSAKKKIRDYLRSRWVGPGFTWNFFVLSSQNSPKPVVIFWSSIPCVFCLYTLLKVVGYYQECSVHVSDGFKKKVWIGVGGWGELYPILFWIFGIF